MAFPDRLDICRHRPSQRPGAGPPRHRPLPATRRRFQQRRAAGVATPAGGGRPAHRHRLRRDGRELLVETLSARGHGWTAPEVYRRERPATANIEGLLARWKRGEIGAVTVTSGENLRNLFDMFGVAGQDYLCDTPLIVVSARIRRIARNTAAAVSCSPGRRRRRHRRRARPNDECPLTRSVTMT